MTVRSVAWVATCCAAFAVGLALGRGCSRDVATPEVDPSIAAARTSESAALTRATSPRPRATTSTAAAGATDPPPSDDVRADTVGTVPAGSDADFPSVDIEVVWPSGEAAGGGLVYVYPAGQTSAGPEPPTSECDAAGRARLHVVAPGRYDVGALLGAFQVLETDVDLPRTGPLRLVLPEPCFVTVHMPERGGAPPGKENESRYRLLLKHDADPRVSWPGRGETTDRWALGVLGPPGSTWSTHAPRGVRCRIEHDARYVVVPESFVAPAEVRIVALPQYPVHLRVGFKAPRRTFDRDANVGVLFELTDGSNWTYPWSKQVAAGTEMSAAVVDAHFFADVQRPVGTLRWSGDAVVEGSVAFSGLREDVQTTIDATVEFKAAWEPPQVAPDAGRPRLTFRVSPSGRLPACVWIVDADDNCPVREVDANGLASFDADRPRWALASRDRLVSDAVRLDDGSSGEFVLPLVEGGWLVVVPATMPPQELGRPRIERADGRPFLFEGCPTSEGEVSPGDVIGPFAPGRVAFRVTLGGRVVAEASADVVAGEHRPLNIPRLRAR